MVYWCRITGPLQIVIRMNPLSPMPKMRSKNSSWFGVCVCGHPSLPKSRERKRKTCAWCSTSLYYCYYPGCWGERDRPNPLILYSNLSSKCAGEGFWLHHGLSIKRESIWFVSCPLLAPFLFRRHSKILFRADSLLNKLWEDLRNLFQNNRASAGALKSSDRLRAVYLKQKQSRRAVFWWSLAVSQWMSKVSKLTKDWENTVTMATGWADQNQRMDRKANFACKHWRNQE